MFNKQFDAIDRNDIENLVANGVPESKTIEYKEQLPGNSDGDKKEFLADVSSFANASGGDILYGVSEQSGIPTATNALGGIDNDEEIRRLEGIIQTSLAPRIVGLQIKAIDGFTNGSIILIRIPKSWNSPHMVTFKGSSRFFARNSAGKSQLDVDEIRSAFIASESLAERLREFRSDRIAKIIADETPVPLLPNPKIVLHLIPLTSFTYNNVVNLSPIKQKISSLRPISGNQWHNKYNFDGLVAYNQVYDKQIGLSYTQVFRNGVVEAVDAHLLKLRDNEQIIFSIAYEEALIKALEGYLRLQRNFDLNPPVFVMLSLLNVKGYKMDMKTLPYETGHLIDRAHLLIPEATVEDYDAKVSDILHPIFDVIWQACGWERSLHYDEKGNWNRKKCIEITV